MEKFRYKNTKVPLQELTRQIPTQSNPPMSLNSNQKFQILSQENFVTMNPKLKKKSIEISLIFFHNRYHMTIIDNTHQEPMMKSDIYRL